MTTWKQGFKSTGFTVHVLNQKCLLCSVKFLSQRSNRLRLAINFLIELTCPRASVCGERRKDGTRGINIASATGSEHRQRLRRLVSHSCRRHPGSLFAGNWGHYYSPASAPGRDANPSQGYSILSARFLACVASVSVELSTGLKHFSLSGRAKKKMCELPSPFTPLSFFCARPNLRAAKERKMPRTYGTDHNSFFAG